MQETGGAAVAATARWISFHRATSRASLQCTSEIRKKNRNKSLRKEYGEDFLKGYRANTQLGTLLKEEGVESLHDLVKRKR